MTKVKSCSLERGVREVYGKVLVGLRLVFDCCVHSTSIQEFFTYTLSQIYGAGPTKPDGSFTYTFSLFRELYCFTRYISSNKVDDTIKVLKIVTR